MIGETELGEDTGKVEFEENREAIETCKRGDK